MVFLSSSCLLIFFLFCWCWERSVGLSTCHCGCVRSSSQVHRFVLQGLGSHAVRRMHTENVCVTLLMTRSGQWKVWGVTLLASQQAGLWQFHGCWEKTVAPGSVTQDCVSHQSHSRTITGSWSPISYQMMWQGPDGTCTWRGWHHSRGSVRSGGPKSSVMSSEPSWPLLQREMMMIIIIVITPDIKQTRPLPGWEILFPFPVLLAN